MSFTLEARAYLADQRLGRIATASPTSEPDIAPVTFTLTSDGRKVIRITPEVIWSWGINPTDTPKHFGGIIERRVVGE